MHLLEYFIEVQQTHSGKIYHDFLENSIIQLGNPHRIYHSNMQESNWVYLDNVQNHFDVYQNARETSLLAGKQLEIGSPYPSFYIY